MPRRVTLLQHTKFRLTSDAFSWDLRGRAQAHSCPVQGLQTGPPSVTIFYKGGQA